MDDGLAANETVVKSINTTVMESAHVAIIKLLLPGLANGFFTGSSELFLADVCSNVHRVETFGETEKFPLRCVGQVREGAPLQSRLVEIFEI
jgi:hypothetical protein